MSSQKLEPGKLPARLLASLLAENAVEAPEVLIGPRIGEDACAIELPAGALVAATDPITLTGSDVGAHAVVINANDVAVTGVRPRWFLAVVLVPPGTRTENLREIFTGMRTELDRLGAVLVGGHTEVTNVVRQPVVVGQMLGHSEDGRLLPTGGLQPGDVVLQIGEAPIEGAAIAANAMADRLEQLGEDVIEAARRALRDP
ncbi:MAG: AIR synthase related protein, partial [Myxococcota bacterium]